MEYPIFDNFCISLRNSLSTALAANCFDFEVGREKAVFVSKIMEAEKSQR